MIVKRIDIEYILHDFLEVRYGIHELENARIVRFIMERLAKTLDTEEAGMDGQTDGKGRVKLDPITGFIVNDLLVAVTSDPNRIMFRSCLLLNSETKEKSFSHKLTETERVML